ncbi:MAG: Fic family protein [Phycisphaerae bacterium]
MVFDPSKPYNDLPPLPPAAEIDTKAILRKCISANRALAELKAGGRLIPNQTILINAIPLQEAQASSEIENIVTTQDALYRATLHPEKADAATKEVLNYRQALKAGWESLRTRPLSTRTFVEVCRGLLDVDIDIRRTPGVTLTNKATGKVIYTPPETESLIRDLLGNLEKFLHDDAAGLDPLIRLAVAHYQFEAIHPFGDGNGRTGRIINILYLIEKGLLEIPVLYLSGHIIQNKNQYYRLLRAVTEKGAWEDWILYMLDAVEETARWTAGRIAGIRQLLDETARLCREKLPTVYSRELVELLFVQPYCRIENLVENGIAKRVTASKYLASLEKEGIISGIKVWKETLYVNNGLLELLVRR